MWLNLEILDPKLATPRTRISIALYVASNMHKTIGFTVAAALDEDLHANFTDAIPLALRNNVLFDMVN